MGIRQDSQLVEALCDIEEGLNDWELDFVEGVARQVLDDKRPLTPDQLRVALKLHDKHC